MDPKLEVAHARAAPPSEDSVYPRMSPEDLATPPPPVVAPAGANPYVMPSPSSGPLPKSAKENLMEMFGQAGKKFSEAARETEGIAGNFWQHLKTGPSITDAAMGRIAQITKVVSGGGYDKIFQQTFECLPDEKFKKAYACYLSTSHGLVVGVLYVSTAKLAFCSDSPVAYLVEGKKTASAIYKVVVPVPHLRSVTPTASQQNPAEKYIQVVNVDNREFWFMGFVNYNSAVKYLQEAARVKTGPSITDAAMGRIAQITKVVSEGGYDKIFQQTFVCLPDEKFKKAYAWYLSTSHGLIVGVLYVSTAKLAFCSDSPVAYLVEGKKTASAIYKVVVPVPHLRSVTPTASQQNPAEKYIQDVSVDNHEFWFMGFVNYDGAVKYL